jgi:glycine cleavage system aminomethyltransferase T
VTSILHSPTLGRAIGLALVEPAVAQQSEFRIRIDRGEEVTATVASLPFYDASGERQLVEEAMASAAERIA